jgi:hypothetical protein
MKQLLTVALVGLLFSSCKTNDDGNSAAGTDFTSYQQYDLNAQRLGSVGNSSDDYKMEEWPQWVYDLFTPMDTVNLKGYTKNEVSISALYPNPCSNIQKMRVFATQPVNLRIVIIDQFKKVYVQKSMHIWAAQHDIELNYADLNMPSDTYYRMFYSFSAEDNLNYFRGHIDFYKTE